MCGLPWPGLQVKEDRAYQYYRILMDMEITFANAFDPNPADPGMLQVRTCVRAGGRACVVHCRLRPPPTGTPRGAAHSGWRSIAPRPAPLSAAPQIVLSGIVKDGRTGIPVGSVAANA